MAPRFPKGTYFIGDLCYMDGSDGVSWDYMMKVSDFKDGYFKLRDGRPFAIVGTGGDGVFPSNMGINFPVDSGTLGCIKLKSAAAVRSDSRFRRGTPLALGLVKSFSNPFAVFRRRNRVYFGKYYIDFSDEEDTVFHRPVLKKTKKTTGAKKTTTKKPATAKKTTGAKKPATAKKPTTAKKTTATKKPTAAKKLTRNPKSH